jgi:hypothetical protein
MRSFLFASLALTLGLGACMQAATTSQLQTRAAFDLQCNQSQVQVVDIDGRTRGVRGCDRQATYVESCDGPRENASTQCTWVLNGEVSTLPK